jgi:hypothetical protein
MTAGEGEAQRNMRDGFRAVILNAGSGACR